MNPKGVLNLAYFIRIFFILLNVTCMLLINNAASAQQKNWMVRLAKIEIDTMYLREYKAAIEEHTAVAVKFEPGVLALYATYEKAHPDRVTVLEIYASRQAYEAHLKTAHFIKYKNGTLKMVKSLELIDLDPIAFATKPNFGNKLENQ